MPGKRISTAFSVAVAAALFAASGPYDQPYRPQYHFSPRQHWTNDPNGTVFFDGEYHLFFQYNPFGDIWGHMSWGHAVSTDLVHWRELPVALPEANGVMIFTGSTVIDAHNSSGFCAGGKPCMVAVYTGHSPGRQTQNLAYSNDRGRSWTKYSGNPVLDLNMADFRDPDVFWSEAARRWTMAVSLPNEHKIRFYGSTDLKRWAKLSDFGPAGATGGQWECPNLVQLPLEGTGERRWVLKVGLNPGGLQGGSGEQYFVGRFDGARFVNENPATTTLWTDYGKDCYCALTFNNLARGEQPVMIGWMNNWQYAVKLPTSPWRGQMTIPRQLSLRRTPEGIRLFQQPAPQLNELDESGPARDHSYRVTLRASPGAAHAFGVKLLASDGSATIVGYNRATARIYMDRSHSGDVAFSPDFATRTEAPLELHGAPLRLEILVDRSSVELFAQDGEVAMTNLVFAPLDADAASFWSEGGRIASQTMQVRPMKSIW
ncbi:MAG TPA: glycoside hydrolase family 32 protein [Bryobacteraceae bacterium]|nr:glycoside hydrolase family 32 protein [Bryobacteraceae bacterium]